MKRIELVAKNNFFGMLSEGKRYEAGWVEIYSSTFRDGKIFSESKKQLVVYSDDGRWRGFERELFEGFDE